MSSKTSSSAFPVGDRDEISDAIPPKARASKARTFIMVGFCASGWVMSFDAVVVGNALPSIAKDLQASNVAYAWVISAYLLASASLLPLWAKLSDVLGRKPIMMTSHMVFLLGTLISALSRNSSMLIAGRALQGVGCGGIEVLMGICIADMTAPSHIGGCTNYRRHHCTILAGVLVQSTSWRWCFWITLAVDIISLLLLVWFMDQSKPKMSVLLGLCSLDWPGAVTVSSGAVLLLSGLQVGSTEYSWATVRPIALLVAGVILLAIFIFLQWKHPTRAAIPLRIFGASSNIAVLVICIAHGFSYIAALFFLPLYFQVVLQWKPIDAGIVMLALAIPLAASIVASGIYIERTGRYRRIICGSAFFLTLGYGLCINLPAHLSWPRVILFQAILALGIGPLFQIPLIALQSRIDPDDITAANSAYAFARELSSSISAVIGTVILQSQLQNQQRRLIAQGLPQQLVYGLHRDFTLFTKGSSFEQGLSTQQMHLIREAISTALRNMWIMYCASSSVAFLTSFIIQHAELSQTRTGLPNRS